MKTQAILDLPMGENDAKANTIRDYLKALLTELWRCEEGFSGKRPFGNSGWQGEVYRALVKAEVISGEIDEDGYPKDYDDEEADRIVFACIKAL